MKVKSVKELKLMASMYKEYLELKEMFIDKNWKLFGVKQELVDTVLADEELYEAAYEMHRCAFKFHFENYIYWRDLLYGSNMYMDKDEELRLYRDLI